jgi:hypothetical protein
VLLAKIKLKDTIDADDASVVIEFFKAHISQHQDAVVNIPPDPKVDAAEKILNKLAISLLGKYEWIELLYQLTLIR